MQIADWRKIEGDFASSAIDEMGGGFCIYF
jgi:hypothetical protein